MNSNEIRSLFLDYFQRHEHHLQASSSVVPKNDPTLLFTNAGMVPFKEVFLGQRQLEYKRATSSQLCVRAGGKHNDLENVGYTLRHHTLFEMLGNFSFGDYAKREAIHFAWDFLTEVLKLDPEKLWVTVYQDDNEAADIWQQNIGISPERIIRCGEADNFWSMGDTGPCGPCSEIFYDHGPDVAGGPPGSANADGDRYVEIWNLVFMQYNRTPHGELEPLTFSCVDTGMGLERITAVMQGVADNYDTDIFQGLLETLSHITGETQLRQPAMRVIVDHIRSACFMIAHGVVPSNEGRGYVLRHIIRRALRYGFKLGEDQPFFYKMVEPLVRSMGAAYPELIDGQLHIAGVLEAEEKLFAQTLSHGLKLLEAEIEKLEGDVLPGEVVFKLYDTYGFPADLTADIGCERNLKIDFNAFHECIEKQRKDSRSSAKFEAEYTQQLHLTGKTEFVGYDSLEAKVVIAQIVADNKPQNHLRQKQRGCVVLDKTPFYAEGGGQVGDSGLIESDSGCFVVEHTTKQGDIFLHAGYMREGEILSGQQVIARVDASRQAVAANHTATHLLHAALRKLLGHHVQQKGSLVTAERLRFDFTHHTALNAQQLEELELLVNQQIQLNVGTHTSSKSLDKAREDGALALFDEKYSAEVRVLKIADFSHEVCGGTHVKYTGEIGAFKIIQETAVASGIRRIEAVTAQQALRHAQKNQRLIEQLVREVKTDADELPQRVRQSMLQVVSAEQYSSQLKKRLIQLQAQTLLADGKESQGIFMLACEIEHSDKEALLFLVDYIKSKFQQHAVILSTVTEDSKVALVASVAKQTTQVFTASQLLGVVTAQIDGRGGGRPTLAQGGGNAPHKLAQALADARTWMQQQLQSD